MFAISLPIIGRIVASMTTELLLALVTFAFVSSITPGPNNLMLMASGANFGFRRSIPHMLGISVGFCLMVFLVGIGLAQIFERYPDLHLALTVVSVVYLLWLAWKIATAAPAQEGQAKGKPFSFLQAAGFQWVNPKAWAMALTAVTVYAPGQTIWAMGVVAVVFAVVNLPSVSTWTVAGQQMRRFLNTGSRLRMFNWTMAILLVASLAMVIRP